MAEVVLEGLDQKDLQLGDEIIGFHDNDTGVTHDRSKQGEGWVIEELDFITHTTRGKTGRGAHKSLHGPTYVRFKVRRQRDTPCVIEQAMRAWKWNWDDEPTPVTPSKKVVPDWPITCPKCRRPHSAVLLFAQYDCKHGCYK